MARTNYCSYPSFELGTTLATGWTNDAQSGLTSTASLTTDPATGGQSKNQHIVVTWASGTNRYTTFHHATAAASFAEGDNVTFSIYAKATLVNCVMGLWIQAQNSSNTQVGASANDNISVTTSYVRYSFTYSNLPAATDHVHCAVRILGMSDGDSATYDIDCAIIEKAASSATYFDGSTTGDGYTYAWTGTANASTSTETEDAGGVPFCYMINSRRSRT